MADVFCTDEDLGDFVQKTCGVDPGRLIALALIDTDVAISNPEQDTEWIDGRDSSPATIWIIKNTRGDVPKPTVTTADGFGRSLQENTGRDHTINIQVQGIKDNVNFFNKANRQQFKVALITSGDLLLYYDFPFTIDAGVIVEAALNGQSYFDIVLTGSDFDLPSVHDKPPTLSIFE